MLLPIFSILFSCTSPLARSVNRSKLEPINGAVLLEIAARHRIAGLSLPPVADRL